MAKISTHTPHARRDASPLPFRIAVLHISTHTPHARRDLCHHIDNFEVAGFQLTRLMRGVTSSNCFINSVDEFQLTRLMRGVTFW